MGATSPSLRYPWVVVLASHDWLHHNEGRQRGLGGDESAQQKKAETTHHPSRTPRSPLTHGLETRSYSIRMAWLELGAMGTILYIIRSVRTKSVEISARAGKLPRKEILSV